MLDSEKLLTDAKLNLLQAKYDLNDGQLNFKKSRSIELNLVIKTMQKENFQIIAHGNESAIAHLQPLNNEKTINVIVDRVFNTPSKMMKLAEVRSIGKTWKLGCDEALPVIGQRAPNPLNYYAAGIASDILANVLRIVPKNLSPKVEMKFSFKEANIMTKDTRSTIEMFICNIFFDENLSEKEMSQINAKIRESSAAFLLFDIAWPATSSIEINGDHFKNIQKIKGSMNNPKCELNGIVMAEKLKRMPEMESMKETSKSWVMAMTKKDLTFDEFVIAEPVNVNGHSLIKATGYCNLSAYETWSLVADENGEMSPAPLDYIAAGTALCLGTHIMAAAIVLKPKIRNFRIEQRMSLKGNKDSGYKILSMDNNILIDSNDSEDILNRSAQIAENSCFAGQALQNVVPYQLNLINKNQLA